MAMIVRNALVAVGTVATAIGFAYWACRKTKDLPDQQESIFSKMKKVTNSFQGFTVVNDKSQKKFNAIDPKRICKAPKPPISRDPEKLLAIPPTLPREPHKEFVSARSSPSFNPKAVSEYGISGQETAQKMYKSLSDYSLGLSYDPSSKTFTVLNSANIQKKEIEKIFNKNKYHGWAPQVLEEVDSERNHLVRLVPIIAEQDPLDRLLGPFPNSIERLFLFIPQS